MPDSIRQYSYRSQAAQADEFYTQLPDIEAEMRLKASKARSFATAYEQFLCILYEFQLPRLKTIATCYTVPPISGEQLSLFDVKV